MGELKRFFHFYFAMLNFLTIFVSQTKKMLIKPYLNFYEKNVKKKLYNSIFLTIFVKY